MGQLVWRKQVNLLYCCCLSVCGGVRLVGWASICDSLEALSQLSIPSVNSAFSLLVWNFYFVTTRIKFLSEVETGWEGSREKREINQLCLKSIHPSICRNNLAEAHTVRKGKCSFGSLTYRNAITNILSKDQNQAQPTTTLP